MERTDKMRPHIVPVLAMLFVCALSVCTAPRRVDAAAYRAAVIDDAGLLSTSEIRDLKESLISFTEYGNALVATANVNNCGTVQALAERYYDQAFASERGAVFLIDMDDREVFWYSRDELYDVLSVKSAMAITDNVYAYATRGEYALCAEKAFAEAVTVIQGGHIRNRMKVYGNGLLALLLALFINYIIVRRTSYVRPGRGASSELVEGRMEMTDAEVVSSTTETKARKETPISHSGGYYGGYSSLSSSGSSSSRSSSGSSSSGSYSGSSSRSSSGSSSSSSGSRSRGGGAGHRF